VATGVLPIDTTGLPIGATFEPGTTAAPHAVGSHTEAGATRAIDPSRAATGITPSEAAIGPLTIGHAFGPRYHIIRVLGAGGMGAVYQAWDSELNVAVALKVIRGDKRKISAEDEKRFKNELLMARQVTHKHVLRIHDLGTIDGIKYITMPYVEGDDLASVLRRSGKMPIATALRYARQIASGLEAAHDAGVVHRDLKPANIMIGVDDNAQIMDFGISASTDQTAGGGVVGTLEYMAPEQAMGSDVDARADIYAFGLILYEMLTGPRRSTAATAHDRIEAMKQRITKGLPPIKSIDDSIPGPVADVVTRCLQHQPDLRYQTTTELVADLARLDDEGNLLPEPVRFTRRHAVAGVVLLIGVIFGTWRVAHTPPPLPPHEAVSVLVADFINGVNDPAFEGSLEQAFGMALEGASFVTAYPRREAQRLAEKLKPGSRLDESTARLISASEGIKIVVAGSIESSGKGYAISVKAIDPAVDKPLTIKRTVASDKAGVLTAVSSLAGEIRTVLGDSTPESAKRAAAETLTASSLDAMSAYARGEELNRRGNPREAVTAFEEAVRLDPGFGAAYLHLASIEANLKMEDKGKAHFQEALKHLDRVSEREKYRILGLYYLASVRDYEKAIESYENLVRLYPADNTGYANLALAYLFVRNVPKAVEYGRKATEIYPKNILQRTNYATYSMYSGDFRTAIAEAQRVLQENPKYEWANLTLSLSTLAQGDEKAAHAAYARLASVSPLGASLANMGEADLEMYYGRPKAAITLLQAGTAADEKERLTTNRALKLVALAEARLTLGQRAAAATTAAQATALDDSESVSYPAARVLIAAGQSEKAEAIALRMQNAIQSQTRSYGRLLEGAAALQHKKYPDAIDAIRAGLKLHDSWAARALLAEVYTAAGQSAQALAEWELCLKRRGEATDVFFADTSTLRYLPPVYYWLARAQDAVGSTSSARANFAEYLKLRSSASPPDPLAADAKRRVDQP